VTRGGKQSWRRSWERRSSLRGNLRRQGEQGRQTGRVQFPLLATQVMGFTHPGDIQSMVTTRGKVVVRRSVGTQMEAPRKDTGIQVSGCRECLSLDQVNDLLSLVAELKE